MANIFKSEPNSVIRISGCPYCKQYKGEVIIANYLKNSGIEFEPQKKFKEVKDSRPLSYDFYLPKQKILIEYNGEQHYRPIEFFGGNVAFKKQHGATPSAARKDAPINLFNSLELNLLFGSFQYFIDLKLKFFLK